MKKPGEGAEGHISFALNFPFGVNTGLFDYYTHPTKKTADNDWMICFTTGRERGREG